MVLSVNELSDGTADTAIADISRELEKLRRTAHALRMPIANSIDLIETFCSMHLAVNLRKAFLSAWSCVHSTS